MGGEVAQPSAAGREGPRRVNTYRDWSQVHAFDGTSLNAQPDGALDIHTSASAGAYAVVLPVPVEDDAAKVGMRFVIELEVLAGAVGLFASKALDADPLGLEIVRHAPTARVTLRIDGDASTVRLCIRNGSTGNAHVRVHAFGWNVRKRFDVTSSIAALLPIMLVSPGEEALNVVAASLSAKLGRDISRDEIGELECRQMPVESPAPAGRLWTDAAGRLAFDTTQELIGLLPTYDPSRMDPRHGHRNRALTAQYLNQSIIRVYHLMRELERRGRSGGTLLEVGSFFGQFSLTFQRLGYQVTSIDRYRGYGGAFDGYVSHLRSQGVRLVDTDRDDEDAAIAGLGQFDVVIAMAVIEHIPHTPREFLCMLASHVAPGGVLALDTPNIARYWNRRRMATGLSTHQAIDNQFQSGIPYEGHHREFTAAEMAWMLGQIGCRDVDVRLFDYNLLEYPELWVDQLRAVLDITVDPSLADTVLATGILDKGMRIVS